MAWIYLAELVGSALLSDHGLDPSPIVKTTPTARASYCPECDEVTLVNLQFGTMCELSRKWCSPKKSTSSMGGSPVRTSPLQELERAWTESEADYSDILSDLQQKYARLSYSLRMSRQLELEDFEKLSEHLPIFGMTVDGLVFLPQKLEPRTFERDGSCLPTPSASTYGSNQGGSAGRTGKVRHSLETMAKHNLWPTPQAKDWKGSYGSPESLKQAIDRHKKKGVNKQVPLSDAVMLSGGNGGSLNPQWVEWLMGYPLGWTELEDLEMQWFRSKREKRSKD